MRTCIVRNGRCSLVKRATLRTGDHISVMVIGLLAFLSVPGILGRMTRMRVTQSGSSGSTMPGSTSNQSGLEFPPVRLDPVRSSSDPTADRAHPQSRKQTPGARISRNLWMYTYGNGLRTDSVGAPRLL